jgi:threonine synthase
MTHSTLTHLECGLCSKDHEYREPMNLCPDCGKPLLVRYDLKRAAKTMTREVLRSRRTDLWRYEEVLPVVNDDAVLSLGEGWTPLIHTERLGRSVGVVNTLIKDESPNPTGSFKARGLCVAVSRAYELGVRELALPSAGNAAGAASAYAAAAGLPIHVFMPRDVPAPFRVECDVLGASVTLVDGLITDCGKRVAEGVEAHGWFDLSTLKEPCRIEGKKTMGYELFEQLSGDLPDVIIYPTGGGTGLIGMWKAFAEMEGLGWFDSKRRLPRMVSVQSVGCAPMVRAFEQGDEFAEPWSGAATIADGLRVPAAIGDFLILRALRESGGTAVAVEDEEMLACARQLASETGIFPAPEGAACLAAQKRLLKSGWIDPAETVVLFNTGTGLKYFGAFE